MTLSEPHDDDPTRNENETLEKESLKPIPVRQSRDESRMSTSTLTPRDVNILLPHMRNKSVMSDVVAERRLSFLPIIRRSSMASSVASSIKSSSLYSSSTGSSSPMSGPSTGFSSPAKLLHLPRVLVREMQPGLFDMEDEMRFNKAMRLPQLESSPTDCRLNLVAQKLQEENNECEEDTVRELRPSRNTDREHQLTRRRRRKNRKRSEQRRKEAEKHD